MLAVACGKGSSGIHIRVLAPVPCAQLRQRRQAHLRVQVMHDVAADVAGRERERAEPSQVVAPRRLNY
jgi:hypothetical protein